MLFVIILLGIIIIYIAGIIIGNFLFEKAMKTNEEKNRPSNLPYSQNNDFIKSHETKSIYMQTFDNIMLHGLLVENNNNDDWVIVCHGYSNNSTNMSYMAGEFYKKGFSTLIPDLRGHGESEGLYKGMGWLDRKDILEWIEYLNEHYPCKRIILYGLSMGGATVMMAGGENLPSNVSAIIEDCGYSSVKEILLYQGKKRYNMKSFPLINFMSLIGKYKAGFSIRKEGSTILQVKKCKIPIFFIHGKEDTFVPTAMAKDLYRAASCSKELYLVDKAEHGMACVVNPKLYWEKIFSFIDKYTYYKEKGAINEKYKEI